MTKKTTKKAKHGTAREDGEVPQVRGDAREGRDGGAPRAQARIRPGRPGGAGGPSVEAGAISEAELEASRAAGGGAGGGPGGGAGDRLGRALVASELEPQGEPGATHEGEPSTATEEPALDGEALVSLIEGAKGILVETLGRSLKLSDEEIARLAPIKGVPRPLLVRWGDDAAKYLPAFNANAPAIGATCFGALIAFDLWATWTTLRKVEAKLKAKAAEETGAKPKAEHAAAAAEPKREARTTHRFPWEVEAS